ncbi:MAG TPA: aminoacyl-tRNA hydrolase [Polyangiaceae bacterium]|nr:aminoacyl-tRNA hydrolase [Polyangiaceae bacterium]
MFLIVGLGNPGSEYAGSRHNVGFLVADELAARFRIGPLKAKFGGEIGLGEARGVRVALLKPMEYMNVSGPPVQRAAAFYQVEPKDIVVLHDDIDLEFGRLKVKVGGGHGGHNGLRSLVEHVGPAFIRVRCGVGHPGHKERVVGHVLGGFGKAEQKELPLLVGAAADAVETIIEKGVVAAMNRFNATPAGDDEGA